MGICFGYVQDMLWIYAGHVLARLCTCFGHIPKNTGIDNMFFNTFWGCLGHVLASSLVFVKGWKHSKIICACVFKTIKSVQKDAESAPALIIIFISFFSC